LVPDQLLFERLFDRFEYVHRLIVADHTLQDGESLRWGSHGIFVWNYERSGTKSVFDFFDKEAATKGGDWPLLESGLFGGSLERFRKAKECIDPGLKKGWLYYR